MTRPILFTLALALLAIPPPAPAGSITYDFSDVNFPHAEIGRMEVDDAALPRGYIVNADLIGFGFPLFGTSDLDPFTLAIAEDGSPTPGDGMIAGWQVVAGTTYTLTVDWGGDLGGYWQVAPQGYPGAYGYGQWTISLVAAAVPEPPSAVLAGLACIVMAIASRERGARRHG